MDENNIINLKGKIWFEFDQYNAQIPELFLVGTGQTSSDAFQNLIDALKEYVANSFEFKLILLSEDSFEVDLFCYGELLKNNAHIQISAHKIEFEIKDDKISFSEYLKILANVGH